MGLPGGPLATACSMSFKAVGVIDENTDFRPGVSMGSGTTTYFLLFRYVNPSSSVSVGNIIGKSSHEPRRA